jgi:tRNA dimethylallyltransferase
MRRPVLLTGPTASGKSGLAMRIAERDAGLVINADALQVYSCWCILTARPSAADQARIPHRLYGHISPEIRYSVGQWLNALSAVLDQARILGLRPIIVGGTGLYLTTLTEGLAEIPPIAPEVRARSQALVDANGLDIMLADLLRDDARSHERIDRANPVRVQRAWEVLVSTGRGLSDWQDETPAPLIPSDTSERYVLDPGIPMQRAAVEARFRRMIQEGVLEECRAFLDAGLPDTLPAARALGAGPLMRHLGGECDLETAIADSVIATRQYSKRQRSWFRNRMRDWTWLEPGTTEILDQIEPF